MIGYRKPAPGIIPEANARERVIWYRGIRWTVTNWPQDGATITHIHRPNSKGYVPELPLLGTVDVFTKHGASS